jgi:hygromycin-B 7''-O-kinase
MGHPVLLPDIGEDAFDALHDDTAAWRPIVAELLQRHAPDAEMTQATDGSVLVGLGGDRVVKLYPPFMRGHFEFERCALDALDGKLSLRTPSLVAEGECETWPYLVMTRLRGTSLQSAWAGYSETQRCAVLERIGNVAAEVHALPAQALQEVAPQWGDFIAQQRRGCHARQERKGLPPHLLADLDRFLEPLDDSSDGVILTGEYTPMNLFVEGDRLVAMFDFGDGLVGPREYDWLGPMCFLAAGQRARHDAFLLGYGGSLDRRRLLRLLLLHRYSNLPAQLAIEDWRDASDLDELAAHIWP